MASTVSDSGATISLRPIVDMPTPVSEPPGPRTCPCEPSVEPPDRSRTSPLGSSRTGSSGGLEEREPDLSVLFEGHPDGNADVDLVGRASHDIRCQAYSRVLVESHHRDDIRVGSSSGESPLGRRASLYHAWPGHRPQLELPRPRRPDTPDVRRVLHRDHRRGSTGTVGAVRARGPVERFHSRRGVGGWSLSAQPLPETAPGVEPGRLAFLDDWLPVDEHPGDAL